MRKPSSPAEALEAVPFLTLLLVPLIPHILRANVIACENGFELPQGCGNVALIDRHTTACERLVRHRMIDGDSGPLTGIRIVRRTEMVNTREFLGFPELFRLCGLFESGLGSKGTQDVAPLSVSETAWLLQASVFVDPAGSVGEGVVWIRGLAEDRGGGEGTKLL